MAHRNIRRLLPFPKGQVLQFGCLNDNYGYLIRHKNFTIAVDVPEADQYMEVLKEKQWELTHCLVTHHHWDHAGGVKPIKQFYPNLQVYGGKHEKNLPPLNQALEHGDVFTIGDLEVRVIHTPGHTMGHVCYHFPHEQLVFVGDTAFAMGCGRMFEGTPEVFHASLSKLSALPDETQMFCGHEYTEANGKFAQHVDASNGDVAEEVKNVKQLRNEGLPTVPSTIGMENRTNPFFRVKMLAQSVGASSDVEAFARLREQKDSF